MARDLRDLPRGQLAVDLLGELLALLVQPRDLVGDVDRRILVHVAQLVDLRLQLGDRLLEIEERLLHRRRRHGGMRRHSNAGGARRRYRRPPRRACRYVRDAVLDQLAPVANRDGPARA